MHRHHRVRIWLPVVIACLAGCGGDGGGSDRDPALETSTTFAQQCAPNNPFVEDAIEPTSVDSLTREKQWVAAYLDDAYLWRDEVPAVDATQPEFSDEDYVHWSLYNYFNALLTPEYTASGKAKDQFSFIYPTRQWRELSESGVEVSYGLLVRYNDDTPRDMQIAYVDAGAPAENAGMQRGAHITHIDGAVTDFMTTDQIGNALHPRSEGERRTFTFETTDGERYSRTLSATLVVKDPVPQARVLTSGEHAVGYLLFNDHFETAEQPLIAAITQFRDAGIDDLVIDLRYNGGGYLYIASQLAYMIAGPERIGGQIFERFIFNDRRQRQISEAETDFPFIACSRDGGFDCRNGTLPTLNLPRVYVIAADGSCSASEALINGLRGIDVDVRLIGGTTCGKPFGFYARDNCGITYFPIEFQGVNAKGFGDYADGFEPDCADADDLSQALGDPREGMLATALSLQAGTACTTAKALPRDQTRLVRAPPRENRLLKPR